MKCNEHVVLQMPAYTIAQNAGVEGAVVVGKLLEQTNMSIGYDAAKGAASILFIRASLLSSSLNYLEWTTPIAKHVSWWFICFVLILFSFPVRRAAVYFVS